MGNRGTNPYDQTPAYIEKPVVASENVWARAVGEFTDMMVAQGLKKQADAQKSKDIKEKRDFKLGVLQEERNYRESSRDEERSFKLSEEERKRGILGDETTPEGKLHSLRVQESKQKLNKKTVAKMPEAVKMEVESLYKEKEAIGDSESDEARAIDSRIASLTLDYDPGKQAILKKAMAKKAKESTAKEKSGILTGIEQASGDVVSDILFADEPDNFKRRASNAEKSNMKLWKRMISSGINAEHYTKLVEKKMKQYQ